VKNKINPARTGSVLCALTGEHVGGDYVMKSLVSRFVKLSLIQQQMKWRLLDEAES
jgi:hypothetical protein